MLALSEEDARLFIEIIDKARLSRTPLDASSLICCPGVKALRAARLEPELRRIALGVLRGLCGRVGHLPESCLLPDKFDLSGMPRASGGFADVWKAEFRGEVKIAIKCLRVSDTDDKAKIHKVGKHATPPYPGLLIRRTALLQGSCHMEELIPSERPQSYWRSRHFRARETFHGLRMDGQRQHRTVCPP